MRKLLLLLPIFLLCVLAVLAGCAPEPTRGLVPRDAPTDTPSPTATRTPGIYVMQQATASAAGGCGQAVAAGAPQYGWDGTVPIWTYSETRTNNIGFGNNVALCNTTGAPITCRVDVSGYAHGWSTALQAVFGCYGSSTYCQSPSNYRELMSKSSSWPVCGLAGSELSGSYSKLFSLLPWSSSIPYNTMVIELWVGGITFGSCTGTSTIGYTLTCGDALTPTPTATVTPTVTVTPSVTPTPTITPTPSSTPTPTATVVPATATLTPSPTPTPVTCAYRYTTEPDTLVAASTSRNGSDPLRTFTTNASGYRDLLLPDGGWHYFFRSKSGTTFTDPDVRYVPTPQTTSCGWQYCVTNDSATPTPVANVVVSIATNKTGTQVLQTGRTAADGCVWFVEDPGTYYIFRTKPGYTWPDPDTEVIP